MLIEFSVENFLSFREKQTFSMVAAPRLRKKENVFKPDVRGEKLPDLLKVAAIYGANASGKSNLIKALKLANEFATRQPSAQSSPLPVSPFRFDPLLAEQPSRIELHFVTAGQRYSFELAATKERIVEERLTAFPNGKETLLYERINDAASEQYTMGKTLEGETALHMVWQKLTNSKTLFIVQAVANSSDNMNQLKKPFKWLASGVFVVGEDMSPFTTVAQRLAKQSPEFASEIALFLQQIDVPVADIQFEPTIQTAELGSESPINTLEQAKSSSMEHKTVFTHKTALGEALFELSEESKGTQNLIGFWLPWTMMVWSATSRAASQVLVVDELDSSLHPNIVASLIKKHLEAEQFTQLIFTTHDTHLMDTKLLRRDQFWLAERDENGATQLRSIHDFEGREGEDLEKRYYEGRYRGLPFIR
ncbi:MAG: ATP-binding protein [Gallionella sp.]|nr:ATP-binding protein [Gallionella sp.]MDD4959778.1 ATP-binding protein [Gallionella sp.]